MHSRSPFPQAAYLASFIARHSSADDALAAETLESMAQWSLKYIAAYDDRYVFAWGDSVHDRWPGMLGGLLSASVVISGYHVMHVNESRARCMVCRLW